MSEHHKELMRNWLEAILEWTNAELVVLQPTEVEEIELLLKLLDEKEI